MAILFCGFVLSVIATFTGLGAMIVQYSSITDVHIIGLMSGFLLMFAFFVAICMECK
jgi:hypothetical protein